MALNQYKDLYDELENNDVAAQFIANQNPIIYSERFVAFKPVGCCLPLAYAEHYESIRKFQVREDDVWILALPRTGSTWMQELVWLLSNNFDYEGAKVSLNERFPLLEYECIVRSKGEPAAIKKLKNTPSPRFIKSHLPIELLPREIEKKKPKIIYMARNPKDQCVSNYHLNVLMAGYRGSMDDFVQEFILDYWCQIHIAANVTRQPDDLGQHAMSPFNHLCVDLWDKFQKDPTTQAQDLRPVVLKTASFLGKTLTETQLALLLHHLSFESMKSNSAVNNDELINGLTKLHGEAAQTNFIRKGQVYSWKEELSAESIEKLDTWIANNHINNIWKIE